MPTVPQQAQSEVASNSSLCESKAVRTLSMMPKVPKPNVYQNQGRTMQVETPGPYTRSTESESLLGLGGGAANVCLGIYFKSSQGPADDQPSVGSLHCIHSTHTVPPEEHESGDERGPHSVAVLTYSGGLLPRAATTGLPCVFSTEWYTFLVSQLYCGVPCIWQNVCQAVPTEFI